MDDKEAMLKQGEKGAWLSIVAYLFLSAIKLGVGYYAASQALFADGLNNTTDIMASIAVLVGLKIARKPADQDHRYGHYRAETVASVVAALIMAGVGLNVLLGASRSMMAINETAPDPIAMWTALFSAGVMMLVYYYNRNLGQRINSQAVQAAAADNRSDALVSVGAFIGIAAAQFGLFWLDPLAALVVGLIILKTAYGIFHDAAHALTDGFDEERLVHIGDVIKETPGVKSIIDLKARNHGNNVYVDVVIGVNPSLTVGESHDITLEIEKQLLEKENIEYVHIHVEPAEKNEKKK